MKRFELAIRNGIVLTMDDEMRVFRPGSIGVSEGVIEYVGSEELERKRIGLELGSTFI